MTKKAKLIALICAIVLFLAGGTTLLIVLLNKDKGDEPTKASLHDVVIAVADKLEETNDLFANASNLDKNSAPVLGAPLPGFTEATIGDDYLWLQEMASQIVYTLSYVANNATIENGYANGFELNTVYTGVITMEGYEGVSAFKLSEEANGIRFECDFTTEAGGTTMNYLYNGFFTYNYETNTVDRFQLNRAMGPILAEVFAIDINFINNSFYGFQAYDYTYSNSVEDANEFNSKYNAGTLELSDVLSYNWTHAVLVVGNLSNNINDITMDGYEFSSSDTSKTVSDLIINAIYKGVYDVTKTLNIRTTTIDTKDSTFVTYLQDAGDYGWNKANFWAMEDGGREYYNFGFIEYSEMLDYLTAVKTQVYENATTSDKTKELIDAAINYIAHKGEKRYTGNFGTYNGISIDYNRTSWYTYSTSQFWDGICLSDGSDVRSIYFEIKDSKVTKVVNTEITYKYVYDMFKYAQEHLWGSDSACEAWVQEGINTFESFKDNTGLMNGAFNGYSVKYVEKYSQSYFVITKGETNYCLKIYAEGDTATAEMKAPDWV